MQNSAETGAYLRNQLEALREHSMVSHINGTGLMLAIQLVEDKATGEPLDPNSKKAIRLAEEIEKRGMLTRTAPFLYLSPPLTLTRNEADEIVAIIDGALTAVEQDG